MDDSTAEQTASNSQPQGATEKPNSVGLPSTQLSKPVKIILGIATFAMVFFMAIFYFIEKEMVRVDELQIASHCDFCLQNLGTVFALSLFLIFVAFWGIVITLIYLKNVTKNKGISGVEKNLCVIFFLLGFISAIAPELYMSGLLRSFGLRGWGHVNVAFAMFLVVPYIIMLTYWYSYIWKET